MTEFLNWTHKLVEVPPRGLQQKRQANDEERRQIAKWLNIVSLDRLDANYRIVGLAGDGYRLIGSIDGDVTQKCVISLEPVTGRVTDEFDVEFWPPAAPEQPEPTEIDALDAAEVEDIENGRINAGRIVIETLSAALDPYPRHPDAVHAPAKSLDESDEEAVKDNPFSILSRLKDKS